MEEQKGSLSTFFLLALVLLTVIFVIVAILTKDKLWRALLIAGALLGVTIKLIYLYWHLSHLPSKLRKKLNFLTLALEKDSLDELRRKYLEVYDLYLKVTSKQKRNFYAKVIRVREQIEDKMAHSKKIEDLSNNSGSYNTMKKYYRKLPKQEQDNYSAHLAHAKMNS